MCRRTHSTAVHQWPVASEPAHSFTVHKQFTNQTFVFRFEIATLTAVQFTSGLLQREGALSYSAACTFLSGLAVIKRYHKQSNKYGLKTSPRFLSLGLQSCEFGSNIGLLTCGTTTS